MLHFIALILVSNLASAACPEFNGTYTCQLSSGTKDIPLGTRVEGGVYIYTVHGYDIPADGVRRDGPFGGKMTATCDDSRVRLVQTAQDQPVRECTSGVATRMRITTRWRPTANGLNERNVLDLTCSDGQVVHQARAFDCPKQ